MTKPRRVVPGTSYMLTRRTTQRMFLLKPDRITREAFLYCFAYLANRHGIEVHWLTVMSNHYHAGIRDLEGKVCIFLREFHSLLARSINVARHRAENLWATEPSGRLELADAEAVFSKMVYGLTNPCTAHLVDKVRHWPGLCSYGHILSGKSIWARRPPWFFDRDNPDLPEKVELQFVRPPQFTMLSEKDWRQKVERAVKTRESQLKQRRDERRIKLVGRKAVRRQAANSQPKTTRKSSQLNPRIAARNKWLRIEALLRNKAFQTNYRNAWDRYQKGERDVLFPYGTYKLRIMGHVRVKPPPLLN